MVIGYLECLSEVYIIADNCIIRIFMSPDILVLTPCHVQRSQNSCSILHSRQVLLFLAHGDYSLIWRIFMWVYIIFLVSIYMCVYTPTHIHALTFICMCIHTHTHTCMYVYNYWVAFLLLHCVKVMIILWFVGKSNY